MHLKESYFMDVIAEFPTLLDDGKFFYMVSFRLMSKLLKQLHGHHHLKPALIFGKVGLPTLFKMHQKGFHPVSLYSKHVKDNLHDVHGIYDGPLSALLHDYCVHHEWGNRLLPNEYRFIFEYALPTLCQLGNIDTNTFFTAREHENLRELIDLNIGESSIDGSEYPISRHQYFHESLGYILDHANRFDIKLLEKIKEDLVLIKQTYNIDLLALANEERSLGYVYNRLLDTLEATFNPPVTSPQSSSHPIRLSLS